MQPKDLRYFLSLGEKEYELPHSPIGWEESTLNFKMASRYYGLFRNVTMPLQFVLDGAYILRRIFYTKGTRGVSHFRVELLNRANWQYEEIFKGEVDFETFLDTANYVEVTVIEGGIMKQIKAYETVQHEYPCDEIDVRLPGIDYVDWVNYDLFFEPGRESIAERYNNGNYIPNLVEKRSKIVFNKAEFKSVEEAQQGGMVGAIHVFSYGFPVKIYTDYPDNYFIKGNERITCRIYGHFHYYLSNNLGNANYSVQVVRAGDGSPSSPIVPIVTLFDTFNKPNSSPGRFRDLSGYVPDRADIDHSFTVNSNERLYIYVRFHGTMGRWGMFRIGNSDITISYDVVSDSTVVKAKRPHTLFREIIEKINKAPYNVKCDIFENYWPNLVVMSGDSIRRVNNPVIKTSLTDFYDSYNAVLNIGMGKERRMTEEGVKEFITLEHKEYYFPLFRILDLGEVASVEFEAAEDHLYSSIKAGYPPDDYEVERGREEYNSSQEWQTPLNHSTKTLNLMSIYSADQNGMEKLRLTQIEENMDKKDKKNDNKTYLVHIKRDPGPDGVYDVISGEDYRDVSGISARTTSYNMEITPKKNLLRHGNYLKSILSGDGYITFASADKNAEFATVDSTGKYVKENTDIYVNEINSQLFNPIYAKIRTKAPHNLHKIVTANSKGYVEFSYLGKKFKGFPVEMSQDVARNSEREFTLLLTANTDIAPLIRRR